jgi:HPt (histidine-containing phosphotransfer) domain-containing protein
MIRQPKTSIRTPGRTTMPGHHQGETMPGETSACAPVDRTHLGRYTLGDPALEREVLGLFLAQIPLTIESLQFAATDRDWMAAAHTLKGSGRAVGAWTIADLGKQAESLGGIADGLARRSLIARIEEAASEVESYFAEAYPAPAN